MTLPAFLILIGILNKVFVAVNDKCPGINDIGRGHQDASGVQKEGGRGETRTEGRKMEEEREGRGTKGGEREMRHNLHP